MVRAILEGRKTQTRRVVNTGRFDQSFWDLKPDGGYLIRKSRDGIVFNTACGRPARSMQDRAIRCPYGTPGDRLWVRETFYQAATGHHGFDGEWVSQWVEDKSLLVYASDHDEVDTRWRSVPVKYCLVKRPSIHMPREFARITLEIVDVRAERLQAISHRDALSEGVQYNVSAPGGAPLARFKTLWDSINARRGYGWSVNPWVWVVEFKRLG